MQYTGTGCVTSIRTKSDTTAERLRETTHD